MWHVPYRPYYELIWDTFSIGRSSKSHHCCAHRILSHPIRCFACCLYSWCFLPFASCFATVCLMLCILLFLRTPFVPSLNIIRLGCNACTCEINICRWLGLQPMFIKDNKNGIYDDLGFCWNAFELMRSKVAFYSNFSGFAMVCLFVWFSTFCSIRSISVCQCIRWFFFFFYYWIYIYIRNQMCCFYTCTDVVFEMWNAFQLTWFLSPCSEHKQSFFDRIGLCSIKKVPIRKLNKFIHIYINVYICCTRASVSLHWKSGCLFIIIKK